MNRNVVIDTNVVVSALIAPKGKPETILKMVTQKEIQPYYSLAILAEYVDVLSRPALKINAIKRNAFLSSIQNAWVLVQPSTSTHSMPDESDRIFYDTANECEAILVTGNKKHFPNEPFVMSPAEYLEYCKT
jgi:putative PIN family toxin of toxin-antitoxin system